MRYLSGIGESCTRVRLLCIARFTILEFTLWTPHDISSSRRFSDSQRVLAICATCLGSANRVLVSDFYVLPGSLYWNSLYGRHMTSPVPGDLATLRGYSQYALLVWDRRIVYSCPTSMYCPVHYIGIHSMDAT